jgi:hypothetical protein
MEYQLWKCILALINGLDKTPHPEDCDYFDTRIVEVFYWAVIHDRPVSWACQRRNWPIHRRRYPLPSNSTMSRRLRTPSVQALLSELECRVTAPRQPEMFWMIDGKPLSIGGCSKDRQAGYGRCAGGKAKGYKIHALISSHGWIAAWRLAPMNKDERVMAERILKTAAVQGYVLADSNYDSNKLHQVCDARESLQLLTRRRYGSEHGTGHRKQSAGRLRAMAQLENPFPAFADHLLEDRSEIERQFGSWTNWGGGLTGLPPWVRTYRRVHRWAQAKLVLTRIKRGLPTKTCAA